MGTQNDKSNGHIQDTLVALQVNDGPRVQGSLRRLARHAATFDLHGPKPALRLSEVLDGFEIVHQGNRIYSGRAVVHSLVDRGSEVGCEVTLKDECWDNLKPLSPSDGRPGWPSGIEQFLQEWQKLYRVANEFKVVVADIQSFLLDLRIWLEHLELGLPSVGAAEREKLQIELALRLRSQVTSALTNMFERFEVISDGIGEDLQPAHRAFAQRQLHPHLLCAPFIHRTYVKPLGYAGDYEMMNMINRSPFEGESLYAMLVNTYLLDQIGPQAVRNRVGFLCDRIVNETSRASRFGRPARIYSIACGPAREVQQFLAEHPLAGATSFRLLDFNEETLRHTDERLKGILQKRNCGASVQLVRRSVQSLLRAGSRRAQDEPGYDLIYCSGLYDYLSDDVCQALNDYLYDRLMPGGLLVVGNFAPNTPVRNFIEHLLEWFLIYRSPRQLAALAPVRAAETDCRVWAEPTTTNIFLEVRKPE